MQLSRSFMTPGSERGFSSLEAIFYLVTAASVLAFTVQLTNQESERQENRVTATNMAMILEGAQSFVSGNYDMNRRSLFQAAQDAGDAVVEIDANQLGTEGYWPPSLVGASNVFGQEYALLFRAVSGDDTSVPAETMEWSDLDTDGDGELDETLIDDDPSNGEMYIEALLVSHGGRPAPLTRGAPITVQTEKSSAGFVSAEGVASGSYGNFTFDITGFEDHPLYPEPGYFASLVSVKDFGVVGRDDPGRATGGGVDDPLRRCQEVLRNDRIGHDDPQFEECLNSNRLYEDLVLQSWDASGDGRDDTRPELIGAGALRLAEPLDTDGDGTPDEFGQIEGADTITMAGPLDTDSDGDIDRTSRIARLGEIECGDDEEGNVSLGTLLISCDDIVLDGDLAVTGDASVEGTQTADTFLSASLGGQDLSEAILDARILESGDTIAKPECPETTVDGTYNVEPRVYVVPNSYSHPGGLPVVGVDALVEDAGDNWRVRLFEYVDEDACTSSVSDPLTLETSDFRSENAAACSASDGDADVYELSGENGKVLAMTRCY